jgi:hypothetical protein
VSKNLNVITLLCATAHSEQRNREDNQKSLHFYRLSGRLNTRLISATASGVIPSAVKPKFLAVIYIYLIGSITFNIVARKSLENTIATMTSQVNKLDLTYLNKVNEIDKDYALTNGFVEVRQNLFVSRDVNHVAIR